MKNVKDMPVAQGDVLIIPRGAKFKMPAGVEEVKPEGGRLIVAHSETGHHHAIDVDATSPAAMLFRVPNDPMTTFLKVKGAADIVHHRPWDTHETLRMYAPDDGECVYEIKRQREPTPEGWRRVED